MINGSPCISVFRFELIIIYGSPCISVFRFEWIIIYGSPCISVFRFEWIIIYGSPCISVSLGWMNYNILFTLYLCIYRFECIMMFLNKTFDIRTLVSQSLNNVTEIKAFSFNLNLGVVRSVNKYLNHRLITNRSSENTKIIY